MTTQCVFDGRIIDNVVEASRLEGYDNLIVEFFGNFLFCCRSLSFGGV